MPEPDLSGVTVRTSALNGGWILLTVEAKDIPGNYLLPDRTPKIMLRVNGGRAFVLREEDSDARHAATRA